MQIHVKDLGEILLTLLREKLDQEAQQLDRELLRGLEQQLGQKLELLSQEQQLGKEQQPPDQELQLRDQVVRQDLLHQEVVDVVVLQDGVINKTLIRKEKF